MRFCLYDIFSFLAFLGRSTIFAAVKLFFCSGFIRRDIDFIRFRHCPKEIFINYVLGGFFDVCISLHAHSCDLFWELNFLGEFSCCYREKKVFFRLGIRVLSEKHTFSFIKKVKIHPFYNGIRKSFTRKICLSYLISWLLFFS